MFRRVNALAKGIATAISRTKTPYYPYLVPMVQFCGRQRLKSVTTSNRTANLPGSVEDGTTKRSVLSTLKTFWLPVGAGGISSLAYNAAWALTPKKPLSAAYSRPYSNFEGLAVQICGKKKKRG